jgi:hypothetical protein
MLNPDNEESNFSENESER